MKKTFFVLFTLIELFFIKRSEAQSLPVGTPVMDDYFRREQLLGHVDSAFSFTIRPISSASSLKVADLFYPDSNKHNGSNLIRSTKTVFANGHGLFQVLPFSWQQQVNTNHPYGWNDGPMISARGYQTMVSGGFYIKLGPLSVQLRPEYVYAANNNFNGFTSGHSVTDIYNYFFGFFRLIDMPEKFGNGNYNKAYLGQSNVKLTFGAVALGLSNENLWWGPGINNALVLTNNAPGFKHITINTTRPVKTFLGSFEGQIIGGRLNASGFEPLLTGDLNYQANRPKDWRYFSGLNINYHPKWVNGFTLGLTRTFNVYSKSVKGFGLEGYIPFFIPYQKKSINNGVADTAARDQITSVYARWLFKKAQAEVYFEYGLEDNSYNIRDFIGSPDHSRAYIFGFRKFVPIINSHDQKILIGAEITQTSQHLDNTIRETGLWYINYQLLDGHTQNGQVLGAGTGPGSNIQSFNLSWVLGLKQIGVTFDRFEHEVDYSNLYFPSINGYSRKWVDYSFGLKGDWDYKNLLFNAKIQAVKSLNYEWILKDYDPSKSDFYIPHNDVFNLYAQLGITFRF